MKQLLKDTAGVTQALGIVIAGLIAIAIGVLVWFKLDAALVTAGWSTLPAAAKTAWNSTNTTAGTVWTLAPVIAIVMIAGVILAVVIGFGRQQY